MQSDKDLKRKTTVKFVITLFFVLFAFAFVGIFTGSNKNISDNTYSKTYETSSTISDTEYKGDVVWISRSGEKYHSRVSCSNMKNPSKVTLDNAISWGYTACSKCY